MAPNVINSNWLRPFPAVCALAGLLALAGCGGGSGAPNNPFAPKPITPGPLFVLPTNAVVYVHTAATLQVSGGAPPYQAFSSNSGVLPVAQNVDTGVIVLIPGDVAADTPVTITVQDAIAQTATASITVRPAPLFNTLTVVPSRTVCGTNAVCSGDTATATVQVLGMEGAGIPNRQVRFDVVLGAFGIQSSDPAQPLVSSLTVVSDATGSARVVLQATVNVPTQPAEIRATDLTTGNSVTASFTIVQQTDGSAILSVIPATATITGPDNAHCSVGVRVDYFIYGGTPPYHVAPSFPDAITMVNTTVFGSGGSFEVITNGSCVNPLTFTIVDAIGRQTTAQIINSLGTTPAPPPPSPPLQVVPPSASTSPAVCTALTPSFGFTITGGTPPFSVASSDGVVTTSPVTTSPGSFTFKITNLANGDHLIFIGDASVPQKTITATVHCGP
jgi:hypothetical protein